MNVIVTAGGSAQPKDALYQATRGGLKAMLEIAGKPMVQWVLDALGQSEYVEQVYMVGLPPEIDLVCNKPMTMLPDHGSMLENIRAGSREIQRMNPSATHAILANGDLPALRPEIIDWLACQIKDPDADIYYTVVERSTMETHFPGSRRTYVHLKNMELCGGDLHAFRLTVATEENPLWDQLIGSRKSPMRQASLVGFDTLFFLMLRQLSLEGAVESVSKRLGIKARAIVSPYPEIGMDVDKPFQLEMMREYLSKPHEKHAENIR